MSFCPHLPKSNVQTFQIFGILGRSGLRFENLLLKRVKLPWKKFCILANFALLAGFFWYWCYYPHRSRDALSPVCEIFLMLFPGSAWLIWKGPGISPSSAPDCLCSVGPTPWSFTLLLKKNSPNILPLCKSHSEYLFWSPVQATLYW